jgi:hypothetical protein
VLTKVAQRFAAKFGPALTKKKLGQFVPVAGMAVGASLNYWVIDQISVAARDAYRERFLMEKSGGTLTGTADEATPSAQDDDVIDVIGLLREEDALPPPDPRENPAAGEEA